VSFAFWSMIVVVLSGVLGRYLYTKVPDLLNGRELEELDHQRALGSFGPHFAPAVQLAHHYLAQEQARAQHVAQARGLLGTFFWILGEDLRRPFSWSQRRTMLRSTGVPNKVADELAYRAGRLVLGERRRVLVPRAKLLLHSWKLVHVPFSFIMAGIAVVHIWFAFQYSM
jgi:hypothetical protein